MNYRLQARYLLILLTGLNFFNYFDRFILASVLESLRGEFSLSDGQAGLLSTAFMLGYFITSPIFGYLGDRWPRKYLIVGGILVWSLGTFLTGFAHSFHEILFYRILVGLGEASYAALSPSLISDTFPSEKRNNALTWFYVAIPMGAAVGTLFGSWMGQHHGWHSAFIWAGAPGLLLAFSLLPFAEPERGAFDKKDKNDSSKTLVWKDVFSLFRIPQYNCVILGYVAYTFAMGAYQHWGQAFLMRTHHISQLVAGNYFGGVMVFAGLFGTFIGGFCSTHWQKKNPAAYALTLGYSVLLAVPLTLLFVFASNSLCVMSAMAGAMLLLFFATGPVNTLILEAVPFRLRASAMAMSIFMIHIGGDLWSPWIVGKISDYSGNLQSGLALLSLALLVCAVYWLKLASLQKRSV